MKKFYLAFDPGGTTGIATYNAASGHFHSSQVEGRHEAESLIVDLIPWHRAVVIGESFIITAETLKKSRQMDPLYIIGYMDGLCAAHGTPFYLQSPSEGKSFGTDTKLKALGWWNPTTGGHANDAARHLLTRTVKERALTDDLMQKLLGVIS